MVRYRFELATPADDAELRSILAATPMEGPISLSLRREPSFFDATVVSGDFHQVVVCRDTENQQISGFGCRSVREMYVNGQKTAIGYLSGLRLRPEYRNRGLIARGYAYFRRLHADGRAPLYLTTIAEGNQPAISTLTKSRAGLPNYSFAGTYHTFVIPVARRQRLPSTPALEVRAATHDDLGQILAFLEIVGPARQFFPCYKGSDFFNVRGSLRDFAPGDLLLAFRGGQLVGTLGGWDQHRFKQSVVERYAPAVRWSRAIYNAWAGIRGLPRLPKTGAAFRYLTAVLPVVLDNDPDVFQSLLNHLIAQSATRPGDFLVIGLHQSDPLLPLLQPFQVRCYSTRTYIVCWDDGKHLRAQLGDKAMYLELGCL